jgi:hypothetical protein
MADDEAPCLAAPALSLPLRPCSPAATTVHVRASPATPLVQSASVRSRRWPHVGTGCWGPAHAHVRSAHPTDRLWVVSELDGPIVDQRHIVRRRLLHHDRVHGTNHFAGVEPAEVDVDAGNLERFTTRRGLPATGAREILDWCPKRASSTEHGPGTVRLIPAPRRDPLVPAPEVHLRRAPAQQWRGASCHRCLGDGPLPDVRRGAQPPAEVPAP